MEERTIIEQRTDIRKMSLLLRKRKQKESKKKTEEKDIQKTISDDIIHIIIGANSPLGVTVVKELLKRGRRVRILVSNEKRARKFFLDKEVEIFEINLKNVIAVINSIEQGAIVYDCVKTPFHRWFRDFPIIHYNILNAVKKHEAKLVYVDNLSVFGKMKGSKISERDPLIPASDEGILRKKLLEQVIIGDQRGDFKAAIARFPDIFGPYVVNDFSEKVFERPLKNQSAKWYIDNNQPHSLIYIKDAANALVNIAEHEEAYGQVWHVAGPKAIKGTQFLKMIFIELNNEPDIKILSKFWIKIMSFFNADLGRIHDLSEQWEYPFVIDGSKYFETFKEEKPTPHRVAIKETLEWFRERIKEQKTRKNYLKYLSLRYSHPVRW